MEVKAPKRASVAHYLYASKLTNPTDVLAEIHAGSYEHSLVEYLYWLAIQRVPFKWDYIENMAKYTHGSNLPKYTGFHEFEYFVRSMVVTEFDIPELYKTCFIEAHKNWRQEEEVAAYKSRPQRAKEDYLRPHEELPTAQHYLLYYFAISHQQHPAMLYIIAGRLEGCGQTSLATRLWDLPTLKYAYPEHREYALFRMTENTVSAARSLLENCYQDEQFCRNYWPLMPRIFTKLIEKAIIVMTREREETLIAAANSNYDISTQIKTILRCAYPTTYRQCDAIGAGFLAVLELKHPDAKSNAEFTLDSLGQKRLKSEYEDHLKQIMRYFENIHGRPLKDRAQIICTNIFSHDFRLLLLKLEEHMPQLQYHYPEICQSIGTMAIDANLLRIANEYYAFAATRLNISDLQFKLAKISEDQKLRGTTSDLSDIEVKELYLLALDGGNYHAAMRLAEIYREKMSPRDEGRSKKIYDILLHGFDAAYNMKDAIGCEAILQSIASNRESQIFPSDVQALEISTCQKLHQGLLQDQQLFHDVLKQHSNENTGLSKLGFGDLGRRRRGNYTRLLALADGIPPHSFANTCMLFIYPESEKAKRLSHITNESSFESMLNYYLWWFRKKFPVSLTPRSFSEIASDVIVRYFEHIISSQPNQSEKQIQAKLFLAIIRCEGITLTDCYYQSPAIFYQVRQAIGKWDRQSDDQDHILAEVEKKCTAEMDTTVLLFLSFMEASLAKDTPKLKELALKIQSLILNFTALDDAAQRTEVHKQLWGYACKFNLLAIAYFINLPDTPHDTFVSFQEKMINSLTWPKLEHYYSKHDLAAYQSHGKSRCASLFEIIKNLSANMTETQANYLNFARIMLYVITKDSKGLKSIYKRDYKLTHSTLYKLLQIENLIGNPNAEFINRYVNRFKQEKQNAALDQPDSLQPQTTQQLTYAHRRPSVPQNLSSIELLDEIHPVAKASYQTPSANNLKRLPVSLLDRSAAASAQTPRPRAHSASSPLTPAAIATPQSKDDTAGLFRRRNKTSPPVPSPSPSSTSTDNGEDEETELNYSYSVPTKGSSHPLLIPRPPNFK